MFHFHTLLCEIASVARKSPNVWIAADRLATSGGPSITKKERAAGARMNHGGRLTHASTAGRTITARSGAGSNLGHGMSFDVRVLARDA